MAAAGRVPVRVSGWRLLSTRAGPEERAERERMLRLAAKRMKQDPVAALREWITIAGSQLGLKSSSSASVSVNKAVKPYALRSVRIRFSMWLQGMWLFC